MKMQRILAEMKFLKTNFMRGLKRLNTAEERISKLEDRLKEIQIEEQSGGKKD